MGECVSNIPIYLGIAISTDVGRSDRIFIVSLIVGRLRVTLNFRAISSRVCCDVVLARAILGIIAILVLGIPASSVVYISRLT